MDVKTILKNSKGQALIEFMLFLPFMLMLYSTVTSMGNALNGSINQQKVLRGYFYYRAQNNSMMPKPSFGNGETYQAWTLFGMTYIGYMDKFADGTQGENGGSPLAPCYRLRLPLGNKKDDVCEEAYSENTTQFIRVGTVYGVCGATYSNNNGSVTLLPGSSADALKVSSIEGCQIQ